MRALLWLAVFGVCGCGFGYVEHIPPPLPDGGVAPPQVSVTVEVVNEYAESLFTLHGVVDGVASGESMLLLPETRLAPGKSARTSPIAAPKGTTATLRLDAMSLGKLRSIQLDAFPMDHTGTYRLSYDYDLATAAFSVRHGWAY